MVGSDDNLIARNHVTHNGGPRPPGASPSSRGPTIPLRPPTTTPSSRTRRSTTAATDSTSGPARPGTSCARTSQIGTRVSGSSLGPAPSTAAGTTRLETVMRRSASEPPAGRRFILRAAESARTCASDADDLDRLEGAEVRVLGEHRRVRTERCGGDPGGVAPQPAARWPRKVRAPRRRPPPRPRGARREDRRAPPPGRRRFRECRRPPARSRRPPSVANGAPAAISMAHLRAVRGRVDPLVQPVLRRRVFQALRLSPRLPH